MKIVYFFFKFCEPPNCRIASISSSCDEAEFELDRRSLSTDEMISLRFDMISSLGPPIRRIVRYSVIVLLEGFGATTGGGGGGGGGTGDA